MADANYFVITVAKCDPTYVPTAMEQIGSVIDDLKSKAGALVVRAGGYRDRRTNGLTRVVPSL